MNCGLWLVTCVLWKGQGHFLLLLLLLSLLLLALLLLSLVLLSLLLLVACGL